MQRKKGHLKQADVSDETTPFQAKLSSEFESKRVKNTSLSLRDFARMLDMPVSTLTMLMRGKAKPTRTTIVKIASKLSWLNEDVEAFIASAVRDRNSRKIYGKQFETRNPEADVLGRLLNLAILSLARVEEHPSDASFIARKLGVSVGDVESSLETLYERNLVIESDGVLRLPSKIPAFVSDPAEGAVKEYKRKFLSYAIDQLDATPVGSSSGSAGGPVIANDSNSVLFYFSASPKDLENVRNRLSLFMRGVVSSLQPSKDDELYCAGALYFPFKFKKSSK